MADKLVLVVENTNATPPQEFGVCLAKIVKLDPQIFFPLERAQEEFSRNLTKYHVVVIDDDATPNHTGRDWANTLVRTTETKVVLLSKNSKLAHDSRIVLLSLRIKRQLLAKALFLMSDE